MTPMSEIEYNRYMEPLRGVIVAKLGQMLDGGIPRDNTYFYESLLVAPQIMTWERFEEFVANARDEFVRAAGIQIRAAPVCKRRSRDSVSRGCRKRLSTLRCICWKAR